MISIAAIMLSSFITVSNAILKSFLQFLCDYYKFETRTQYNLEVAKGIAISQFLNTAMTPFMLQVLFSKGSYIGKIFGSGGHVYN